MVLSVIVALVLSPALTATLLKRPDEERAQRQLASAAALARLRRPVQRLVRRARSTATATASRWVIDRNDALAMLVYAAAWSRCWSFVFLRLPTSFLPIEDQGFAQIQFTLPPGATQERTLAAAQADRELFPEHGEGQNVDGDLHRRRREPGGGSRAECRPRLHRRFTPWDERKGSENNADGDHPARHRARWAAAARRRILRAQPAAGARPRPVERLHHGAAQHRRPGRATSSRRARDELLAAAQGDPSLTAVRLATRSTTCRRSASTSTTQKVGALGLTQASVDRR